MMTKISVPKILFSALLMSVVCLHATDIGVPSSPEIIVQSNAILLVDLIKSDGVMQSGDAFYVEAKVREVLKGDPKLANEKIKVISPYADMSFPFASWVKDSLGTPVLLLGAWDKNTKSISLIYGTASFWPKGAPMDVLAKGKSIQDCKSYVEKSLKPNS